MGDTVWDDIKKKRPLREGNKEAITRMDASSQIVANVRPIVLDIGPYGCNGVKMISCIIRGIYNTEAVSGPPVHQTPEPSLLFPSMSAAFLTGSGMDELGRRLHVVGSNEEMRRYSIRTKVRVALSLTSSEPLLMIIT